MELSRAKTWVGERNVGSSDRSDECSSAEQIATPIQPPSVRNMFRAPVAEAVR
jgi:hypothetical protein